MEDGKPEHGQSTLSGNRLLPSISTLDAEIEGGVSREAYKNYYAPVFTAIDDASAEDPVPTREVYEAIPKDTSEGTKWDYVCDIFEYDPELAKRIADRLPPAAVLVELGARQVGTSRDEFDIRKMNSVQQACAEYADVVETRALQNTVEQICNSTIDNNDFGNVDQGLEYAIELMSEGIVENVDVLYSEFESIQQSKVAAAGEANEVIVADALRSRGLEEGVDFSRTEADELDDIRLYAPDKPEVTVEIKSIGVRERADAGLSRLDDPTVLFGFFDDPREVEAKAERLSEECERVYLPKETIDAAGKNVSPPFFQPNVRFADDAYQYCNTPVAVFSEKY